MYLRLGLHVQIRLYNALPYKAKILAQHGIGFILDRCIVYLGLTMPNLQKKRLLIFEIFNIKKCTPCFFLEPCIYTMDVIAWILRQLKDKSLYCRVLGELRNSHGFSQAFNCPVGSYMNPDQPKCSLW